MEMKTKILDKKHMIIISIAIISIIIGVINATYAYFSDRQDKEILFGSASNFGGGTLQKTDVVLSGEVSSSQRISATIPIKFDDVTENDYLVSLIAEFDINETTFNEETDFGLITFEVYHKTNKDLDTSTFICTDNIYNNGTSSDYCNGGTINSVLYDYLLNLISEYRISDAETHYFDVYLATSLEQTQKVKLDFYYLYRRAYRKAEEYLNEPDLSNGLIPVVYDDLLGEDTNWFVADTTTAWYDYDSQWWANAVSVDSTTEGIRSKYVNDDGTYKSGTEIAQEDMLAMFVWIPRFSYTIGCTNQSTCLGYKIDGASDLTTETPGAIDISFIKNNTIDILHLENNEFPNYMYDPDGLENRKPDYWYTHPAFWWDNNSNGIREEGEELSGIWVGKFETSINPDTLCYKNMGMVHLNGVSTEEVVSHCLSFQEDITPRILPEVTPTVFQNIYDQYQTAKKFTSNAIFGLTGDAHMMKNSEWGAVVYLSQSIYGKYGNPNYTETNKEIFLNNSTASGGTLIGITGRSVGGRGGPTEITPSNESGIYKYDDMTIDGKTKVSNSGTGSSTTGNIYGIYDMNGGAYEYVMGYYTEASSDFGGRDNNGTPANNSGFTNDTKPESKFFDGYKGTISGDTKMIDLFTKSNEVIGHATAETKSWYSDNASTISVSSPWVTRGGYFFGSTTAGAFNSYYSNGEPRHDTSFRSVLATIEL